MIDNEKLTKLYSEGFKAFSLGEKFYDVFSGIEIPNYVGKFFLSGYIAKPMEVTLVNGERSYRAIG